MKDNYKTSGVGRQNTTMIDTQFNLVVIGHLTVDLIELGHTQRYEMGGPPAYAMVALALGLNKVGIVSRIGKTFPQDYFDTLTASGLNLDGLMQNETTTQFTNTYTEEGNRTQHADVVAKPICSQDVPVSYWDTKWMHISPVLHEVESSIITQAKEHEVMVSVDAQGFVRTRADPDNRIISCQWTGFPELAPHIDILKADIEEICQLAQKSTFQDAVKAVYAMGCPLILITHGQQGSFLYHDDHLYEIPAITPEIVVDHTGSGDVFAISYLTEFQHTQRPLWSAFFASACASFNVETPGPTSFPSHEDVVHRLRGFLALPTNRTFTELLFNEPGPRDCPL